MARSSVAARMQAIVRVHREIAWGGYPNCNTLAKKLQISAKTVCKYIRQIPEVTGANAIYDRARYGYYFAKEREKLPMPVLSDHEVIALFVFEQAANTFKNSPVGDLLQGALDKLALMMPDGCTVTYEDVSSSLSLRPEKSAAVAPASVETLKTLYRATRDRKCVAVTYRARESGTLSSRTINPLHLTRSDGQWFVVAYCQKRKAIRTFVPARMESIRILAQTFKPPEDFDAEAHFRTAFGIVSGLRVRDVSLRFDKETATLIKERRWHATQVLEDLPGGEVRLRMTCSTGKELVG